MALARNLLKSSRLCNLCDFTKISKAGSINDLAVHVSVRTAKHYNPKYKWLRGQKVIKTPLPFTEKNEKESFRTRLFKLGISPRYWKSRPMTILSAQEVFDPYKPAEGDSKVSVVSKAVTTVTDVSKQKFQTLTAVRKIKNYDSHFKVDLFPQEAQDIYIKAHTVLMNKDPVELSKYVTELANSKMMEGIKKSTIRWKFIEFLEPPKVVQARVHDVLTQTNLFAQVTVKFHSKQCLAIYDRFGRLSHGSEILAKDVLEYVVFEKHINNEYGVWRLHEKIIPDWIPKMKYRRTYRVEKIDDEDDEEDFVEEDYDVPEEQATTEVVQSTQKTLN